MSVFKGDWQGCLLYNFIIKKPHKKQESESLSSLKSVFIYHSNFMPTHNKIVPEKTEGTFYRLPFAFLSNITSSSVLFASCLSMMSRDGGICFHVIGNPLSVYRNEKQTGLSGVTSNCCVLQLLWWQTFCAVETNITLIKKHRISSCFSSHSALCCGGTMNRPASSRLCCQVLQCLTSRLAKESLNIINMYLYLFPTKDGTYHPRGKIVLLQQQ